MLELYVIWDDKFGERVMKYLQNDPEKMKGIVGIDEVPSDVKVSSPSFIDNVDENLPENLPSSSDIILAMGVGLYIQALPALAERLEAEAVIVPIEDSDWYPLGLLNQTKKSLEKRDVEVASPRPFCSLRGRDREFIEKFINDYGIGNPSLEVRVEDGRVNGVEVEVCAPCGSTENVARKIEGAAVSFQGPDFLGLEDRISEAWHSYPCTADMQEDPVLGETILHRAGYVVRKAVKSAIGMDLELKEEEREEGKVVEKCDKLCGKCVEACEKAGNGVLEIQAEEVIIPDYERCVGCRSCVKACPIDVAGRVVTKRDNLLLRKWDDKELSN